MIETTFSRVSATSLPPARSGPLVPLDRFPQPLPEVGPRDPPEAFAGAGGVHAPPGLAVGPARVPATFAAVAGQLGDQFRQGPDRDLPSGSQVHRLRRVVPLGGRDDPLGRVPD